MPQQKQHKHQDHHKNQKSQLADNAASLRVPLTPAMLRIAARSGRSYRIAFFRVGFAME